MGAVPVIKTWHGGLNMINQGSWHSGQPGQHVGDSQRAGSGC